MIGYIIGTILGGLILTFALGWWVYLIIKRKLYKNLVREIGQSAEIKINSDIKLWANHTKNYFIDRSLFAYASNKVFEVDSILLTDKAIIVVEIKSIKGGIKGDAKDDKWIKILGDKEFYITNPIKQNDRHIRHVIAILAQKVPIVSLIVYSNRATELDIQNIPQHAIVIRHVDLFDTLDRINATLPIFFEDKNLKAAFKTLKKQITNKASQIKLHRRISSQERV